MNYKILVGVFLICITSLNAIPLKSEIDSISRLYKELQKDRYKNKIYNKKKFYSFKEETYKLQCYSSGSNTSSCKSYLYTYPYGYFAKEISERIEQYEKDLFNYSYSNKKDFENKYWKIVLNENTKLAYNMYLKEFPRGQYRKIAKENSQDGLTSTQRWLKKQDELELARKKKEEAKKEMMRKKYSSMEKDLTNRCNKHDATSCFKLANFYSSYKGNFQHKKSITFHKKACVLNNAESCSKYAEKIKNWDEKINYFKKSCNLGYEYGCYGLVLVYGDPNRPGGMDIPKKKYWMKRYQDLQIK